MVSQKVTVMNASGLHARPANAFVKEAVRHAGCNILIKKDSKTYMGKSIVSVTLRLREVRYGDRAGRRRQLDEAQALQDMVNAVNSGLGGIIAILYE